MSTAKLLLAMSLILALPIDVAGQVVVDLSIAKVDDKDPVDPGDTLTYTVTVTNAGPDAATNVVVTDTLPAGVTLVSTTGCGGDPNGVPTCTLGTIPFPGSKFYTIEVTVDATTIGLITNLASVTSDHFVEEEATLVGVSSIHDPNIGNNSTSEDTRVVQPQSADLSIDKADDVDPIIAGNTLIYTVTVTNAGLDNAKNVVVTDTLPAGVTLVSTSGCAEPIGVPTCTLGSIPKNTSKSYTITVTVDASTTGTITNLASVSSDDDHNPANDLASEDTTIVAPGSGNIDVTYLADPPSTAEGQSVQFVVGVENRTTGGGTFSATAVPAAITDFILTSLIDDQHGDLNGQGTCSVPQTVPAGGTYSCRFPGVANNQGGGQYVSTVTATGGFGTPIVSVTGSSTVEVTITAPVPTMGEWGLILLALLLMTVGVVSVRRGQGSHG